MSVKLIKQALKSSAAGADRLALVVLSHLASDDGDVALTYKELALALNVTRRACINTVTRLIEDDHITLVELSPGRTPNIYRINSEVDFTVNSEADDTVGTSRAGSNSEVGDTVEDLNSEAGFTVKPSNSEADFTVEPPTSPVRGDSKSSISIDSNRTPPISPPQKTAKKKNRKRKSQLPAAWEPNEKANEIATNEGYDNVEKEIILAQFIDHAKATGRSQLDWNRAFYTWIRSGITRSDIAQRRRADPKRQSGQGRENLSALATSLMSRSTIQ